MSVTSVPCPSRVAACGHGQCGRRLSVAQAGGQNLYFCAGVALVNYTGTGDGWQRDDLVFTIPAEQGGVANPPELPIPNFVDSVVTVVPATIQSTDPDDPVGWGIDNADSVSVDSVTDSERG
jgi:hypothetical protein